MAYEDPLWTQDRSYAAHRDRRALSTVWGTPGVISGGAPSLSGLNVTVAPLVAVVSGAGASQGSYIVESTASETVTVARPGSSAWIAAIVARVNDPLFGDSGTDSYWTIEVQYGDLGVPDPGVPASPYPVGEPSPLSGSALVLAAVWVPAVGAARLIDRRRMALPRGAAPIGTVQPYVGVNPPDGWVLCDGGEVSRVDCWAYWVEVGTRFGAGNGSTTVNVPDLRGRTVFGRDGMGGGDAARISTADQIGQTGGSESVSMPSGAIPAHTHTMSSEGDHDHGGTAAAGSHTHAATQDPHRHGIGGDTGFRFVVTVTPSTEATASAPGVNGVSATNMDLVAPAISVSTEGLHAHTITTGGAHTHTIDSTGGGDPFNVLPPHMVTDWIVRVA